MLFVPNTHCCFDVQEELREDIHLDRKARLALSVQEHQNEHSTLSYGSNLSDEGTFT